MDSEKKQLVEETVQNNIKSNSSENKNDPTKNYKYLLYKQESFIEDIPETHVLKAVEKKLGTKHFLLLTYKLTSITDKLGLLGDYNILNVFYLDDQGSKEHLTFFVKCLPISECSLQFAKQVGAFEKEMFAYRIFKEFKNEEVCLINNVVPQCYVAASNSYLILDDLNSDGYNSLDKHLTLDYDTVLVVLRALASFHASSIIFESKVNKNLYDLHSKDFEESFFNKQTNQQGVDASINCILDEIDLFDFPKVLKCGKNFADVAKEVCYKIFDLVKPSKKYRNVLTHGDIWATNIMIKRDEKTKKPIFCKLVDFQCGRYVPPAQDVLSFLFLNTSRKFRQQYMYEVMGMYYSFLEKNLKYFGLDNTVLSFSDFMDSCEELKIFAIIQAASYFQLILIKNNELEKYFSDFELNEKVLFNNRIHLVLEHVNKDVFYKERLKESIEDLYEFCEHYK